MGTTSRSGWRSTTCTRGRMRMAPPFCQTQPGSRLPQGLQTDANPLHKSVAGV
jgi:hypothetical protein